MPAAWRTDRPLNRALHIVRGHFKHFDDHPLFGIDRGMFWWPMSASGSSDAGLTAKSYEVSPTNGVARGSAADFVRRQPNRSQNGCASLAPGDSIQGCQLAMPQGLAWRPSLRARPSSPRRSRPRPHSRLSTSLHQRGRLTFEPSCAMPRLRFKVQAVGHEHRRSSAAKVAWYGDQDNARRRCEAATPRSSRGDATRALSSDVQVPVCGCDIPHAATSQRYSRG
jgi:hypothetical protein